jgi:hypothetical protein
MPKRQTQVTEGISQRLAVGALRLRLLFPERGLVPFAVHLGRRKCFYARKRLTA